MKFAQIYKALVGAAFVLALSPSAVMAQATRTWVSGVGDDANPCSRTAPCKTFAGAISKTAAGGEISVLDPGGFGAVTITKSISIVAASDEGGVLAASTNGIIINALDTDSIHLQGLVIEGAGTGLNGVRVLKARSVTIRDCVIRGFNSASAGNGISVESTGLFTRILVEDTLLSKNVNGVSVKPGAGGGALVEFDDTRIVQNSGSGVRSDGANSSVRLNASTVTFNGTGLNAVSGGAIISFGNNVILSNTMNGAPTSTLPLM